MGLQYSGRLGYEQIKKSENKITVASAGYDPTLTIKDRRATPRESPPGLHHRATDNFYNSVSF